MEADFLSRDELAQQELRDQYSQYTDDLEKLLAVTAATNNDVLLVMGVEDSGRKQHKPNTDYIEYDNTLADEKRHHLTNIIMNYSQGQEGLARSENLRDLLVTFYLTFTKNIEQNNIYQGGKNLDLYKNFKALFTINTYDQEEKMKKMGYMKIRQEFANFEAIKGIGDKIDKATIEIKDEDEFILHKGDRLIVRTVFKLKNDIVGILEGSFENVNKEHNINRFELLYLGKMIEELSIRFNQLYSKFQLNAETKRKTS